MFESLCQVSGVLSWRRSLYPGSISRFQAGQQRLRAAAVGLLHLVTRDQVSLQTYRKNKQSEPQKDQNNNHQEYKDALYKVVAIRIAQHLLLSQTQETNTATARTDIIAFALVNFWKTELRPYVSTSKLQFELSY